MRDWLQQVLGELVEGAVGCVLLLFLLVWWVGGPGVTALLWSEGDKRLAVEFLAAWAVITVLYFPVSRLIRRARRA
ncbi:hypothetical protein [Streptomyces sp. HD]|uniref:hypothetical protein n=1 Tax=Streptomyces sp. HD TaxID=3020892 RepID=UPI00232FBF77|nr:hypothetical protein [Streptomyces sp. HD]MDC0769919.1 hypothetical protein [Streptomyces sp. HD]